MITNDLRKYFFLALFFMTVSISFAQSSPPSPNPPPPGLPLDGGIFILGLLAVVYGFIRKNKE